MLGYVISKKDGDTWSTSKQIEKINNWVLDKNPREERVLKGSLEWFDIAASLHAPIENLK
jgi:hypothetical protein